MNAHLWSVVCAYCILLINCIAICLSNTGMYRCVNFLADFVI